MSEKEKKNENETYNEESVKISKATKNETEETVDITVNTDYDENSIEVLEGLEPVRKRPGMYIGSTSARGLHHLVWEIVDNSIDEHLAGHCSQIDVTIHKDNSITVVDNGRGIPTGIHPKMGIPTVEVVLTVLHAGGKFQGENSGYKVSGGLHGVGSSVTNALSERMVATIHQKGKAHRIEFSRGNKVSPLQVIGDSEITGTVINFKPDSLIFTETTEFKYETIYNRLRESAFLNRGLVITLTDERHVKEETGEFVQARFCYEGGIADYVKYINKMKKAAHESILYVSGAKDGVQVEVAFQYHEDQQKDGTYSFANNVKTHEGGVHETGFRNALRKTVNEVIRTNGIVKGSEMPNGEDVREGLTAVVSVKVPEPQFEGQTKTKLGNSEVQPIVESIVSEALEKFFLENPLEARAIAERVAYSFTVRLEYKKLKELAKKKRAAGEGVLGVPGKLADCSSKDPSRTEIFIVEGDSAGGSAKQGRNREIQAILPLRGKVINTERATLEKMLNNKEIEAMRYAIGTDFGEDFKYEKLRYNKIIIMTDADVDGAHIEILLLTFFFRHMRELVEKGHVYIANPPLYGLKRGDKVLKYVYKDSQLPEAKKEHPGATTIQRYKGLGEMNPEQLWETTMDPEQRMLFQVSIEDAAEAETYFTQLMGEDPELRRDYIQANSHLADVDA